MELLNTEQTGSILERTRPHSGILTTLCLVVMSIGFSASAVAAPAMSKIFIKNDTVLELTVESIETSGDPLNKKAWKRGAVEIPRGTRKSVLTLTRSGKVNWMDPTPRFVEPGKTAVFAIQVTVAGAEVSNTITLKQKLLGTGKSSKMWHSIEVAEQSFDWLLDDTEVQGTWNPNESIKLKFKYQSFTEKGATHIQYEFTAADS